MGFDLKRLHGGYRLAFHLVNRTIPRKDDSMRALVIIAAVLGLVLSIMGAVGAHMLERPAGGFEVKTTWDAAMLYGFAHVAAILATCALPLGRIRLAAGWLFVIGVLFFSVMLLAKTTLMLQASETTPGADPLAPLGMLAPVGGISFMIGWVALAFAALRHKPSVAIGDQP